MISSLLNAFGSDAGLVAEFWVAVFELFASIQQLTLFFKVVFHHIDVIFICLVVDAWVFKEQYAEFVEGCSYFDTLLFPGG